jgi:hypothetical protein
MFLKISHIKFQDPTISGASVARGKIKKTTNVEGCLFCHCDAHTKFHKNPSFVSEVMGRGTGS